MDNPSTDAWVYVAKKPKDDPALRPYTWYKRFLVEGAREHSLPEGYIAELDRIDAVAGTDECRDREKRARAIGYCHGRHHIRSLRKRLYNRPAN
jgi:hypothetical protein